VLDRALELRLRSTHAAEDFERIVLPCFPGLGLNVVRQRLNWVAQAKSYVLLDSPPGTLCREVLEAFHRYSPCAEAALPIVNLETESSDDLHA
jgi:hypothetical protein